MANRWGRVRRRRGPSSAALRLGGAARQLRAAGGHTHAARQRERGPKPGPSHGPLRAAGRPVHSRRKLRARIGLRLSTVRRCSGQSVRDQCSDP
jgi:hypothetical protein